MLYLTKWKTVILPKERGKGKAIEQICRDHQISVATFNKWKDDQRTETSPEQQERVMDVLGVHFGRG